MLYILGKMVWLIVSVVCCIAIANKRIAYFPTWKSPWCGKFKPTAVSFYYIQFHFSFLLFFLFFLSLLLLCLYTNTNIREKINTEQALKRRQRWQWTNNQIDKKNSNEWMNDKKKIQLDFVDVNKRIRILIGFSTALNIARKRTIIYDMLFKIQNTSYTWRCIKETHFFYKIAIKIANE